MRDPDGQTFPCGLSHNREETQGAALVGSDRDEIIGPDVVPVLRASSYAGTVIQPETTAFGVFLRHL